jgi:hypothetical protein
VILLISYGPVGLLPASADELHLPELGAGVQRVGALVAIRVDTEYELRHRGVAGARAVEEVCRCKLPQHVSSIARAFK